MWPCLLWRKVSCFYGLADLFWKRIAVSVLTLQMFLRDAKQGEVLLNQQENFLSKEDVPVSGVTGVKLFHWPHTLAAILLMSSIPVWFHRAVVLVGLELKLCLPFLPSFYPSLVHPLSDTSWVLYPHSVIRNRSTCVTIWGLCVCVCVLFFLFLECVNFKQSYSSTWVFSSSPLYICQYFVTCQLVWCRWWSSRSCLWWSRKKGMLEGFTGFVDGGVHVSLTAHWI